MKDLFFKSFRLSCYLFGKLILKQKEKGSNSGYLFKISLCLANILKKDEISND